MSSPLSADYSPTSNYSYLSDLTLSPISPTEYIEHRNDQIPPPRLSSPHIFRNIFSGEAAGPSTRPPPRLPPLHEIAFAETMQDVNRALQSANRAIQNAQEAFQSRQPSSFTNNGNRRQDVVDLTNSPPSPSRNNRPSNFDSFLTRSLQPHTSPTLNRAANNFTNAPSWSIALTPNNQSLFVEEEDPTSRYAGQSDSLAGAQRRHNIQTRQPHHRRSYLTMPSMDRSFARPSITSTRRQDEEDAIRRQRMAREQWQRSEQQRQQRTMTLQNPIGGPAQMNLIHPLYQPTSPLSGAALYPGSSPPRPSSRDPSTSSSVASVDLTSVNDKIDLAAALLRSQAEARPKLPDGTNAPRSALTAYKCPICLESPRNATTTICGHLFCHECIMETLKNSEATRREEAPPNRKVRGVCPVCRKELTRKDEEGNGRNLVPLEIQLISKKMMADLEKKELKRKRDQEKASKGKGKQKAEVNPDKEIFELSSDDDNVGSSSQSKAKRVKLSASEERDQELFGDFLNDDLG